MKIDMVQINHCYRTPNNRIQLDELSSTKHSLKADLQLLLDLPNTISVDVVLTYKGQSK